MVGKENHGGTSGIVYNHQRFVLIDLRMRRMV